MSQSTYIVAACFAVLGSHSLSVFQRFSLNPWHRGPARALLSIREWGLESSLPRLDGNEDTWIPAALGLSETVQQGWEPREDGKGNYSVANAVSFTSMESL